MSRTPLLTLTLASALLCLDPLLAGGRFELGQRVIRTSESGTVTNQLIFTDGGTFAFMPPPLWKLDTSPGESRISFVTADYSRLSIRLDGRRLGPDQKLEPEDLRSRLQARMPESEIVAEGICYSEATAGPWFDLVWRDARAGAQRARIAFIAISGTVFEFTLQAAPGHPKNLSAVFQDLLTSFQLVGSDQVRKLAPAR